MGEKAKKKTAGRPKKYKGSQKERNLQSQREYTKRHGVKNVSLDQECIDLLHGAGDIINSKLPEAIRGTVTLRHKDILKIALREYMEGSVGNSYGA